MSKLHCICEKCGHEMPKVPVVKVIAVITNPGEYKHSHEVRKILECLKRNHAPPFDKITTKTS